MNSHSAVCEPSVATKVAFFPSGVTATGVTVAPVLSAPSSKWT